MKDHPRTPTIIKSIPKKSTKDWLLASRKPLLDFLRNLTSQTLFAALTGFAAYRLTTKKSANWDPMLTLSLLFFGSVFVLAFAANASIFFEELFNEYIFWRSRALRHLKRSFPRDKNNPIPALKLHWRQKKKEFLLVGLWSVLLLFIFAAVLLAAIFSANSYVKQVTK